MLRPIPHITGDRAMAERTRILITGAASGIGAAIGRALALPDTTIMLHTRHNRAGIESVAAELRLKGAQTALALGDLADPGTADRLVAETVERLGGLDVVISNAGFADRTPISSLSDAAMHASVEAIQGAFFRLARAATPHLCAGRNPRVVAVSSFVAHTFRPDIAVFPASAAAKAGLEALVRTLAIELAPSGVTVNAVVPGFIRKDAGGAPRRRSRRARTADGAHPTRPHRIATGRRSSCGISCVARCQLHYRAGPARRWRSGHLRRAIEAAITRQADSAWMARTRPGCDANGSCCHASFSATSQLGRGRFFERRNSKLNSFD